MPRQIEPMRAVTGELPPAGDDSWCYEVKWDGIRAIGFIDEGRSHRDDPATTTNRLCLQSSNLIDITARYPELAPLADELAGHRVILDGEIVAFNDEGRPDFGRLQQRMHINGAKLIGEWSARQPIVWVIFDLLYLDGHLLTSNRSRPNPAALPYEDRRRLLQQLVEAGPNWQVPASYEDGAELLQAITERGMEGVMAKRRGSVYQPGRRSTDWRKVKVRRRQELVVGGWRQGTGTRSTTIGALLLGYHDDEGHLVYAGKVGTGFSGAELDRLEKLFAGMARDTPAFDPAPPRSEARDAHWLEPTMVVEVAFAEWSSDGVLRHPSYLGQRTDKDPARVVREPG
jgi:bifunctional non-homologous end joining protein LigD